MIRSQAALLGEPEPLDYIAAFIVPWFLLPSTERNASALEQLERLPWIRGAMAKL